MLDRGIQPIKLFARADFDRILYLSKNYLGKPELEILLSFIAISTWGNTFSTGPLSLNQYVCQEHCMNKGNASRYLKKFSELKLILPVEGYANTWRLLYYIANRQRLIYNLNEFDGVQTVFNRTDEAGENEYRIWLGETEDFRKKNSPSFRNLQKDISGATEQVITVKEHEKRMADAKNKSDEGMKLMRTQFQEIVEEMKAERAESKQRHEELLGLLKTIASKVDLPTEEKEEVKRHLSLVKSNDE